MLIVTAAVSLNSVGPKMFKPLSASSMTQSGKAINSVSRRPLLKKVIPPVAELDRQLVGVLVLLGAKPPRRLAAVVADHLSVEEARLRVRAVPLLQVPSAHLGRHRLARLLHRRSRVVPALISAPSFHRFILDTQSPDTISRPRLARLRPASSRIVVRVVHTTFIRVRASRREREGGTEGRS